MSHRVLKLVQKLRQLHTKNMSRAVSRTRSSAVSIQIFRGHSLCTVEKMPLKSLFAICNGKQISCVRSINETPKSMIFGVEDSLAYANAAECHICSEPLTDDRVRDHCHLTGINRGAAHSVCNLQYRLNPKGWKLPAVIHNLKGYDGHLIVKSLKSEFGMVRVIPQNLEKYLSLSVGQLKFLDSFQFTSKSLDVLSKTLEDDEFRYLVESSTTSHVDLIRRKGVYPYDYMEGINRFDETALPLQEAFYNMLLVCWRHLGASQWVTIMMCIYSWMSYYWRTFLESCAELDPLHYFTTPGLAWDAALRMSRVDLELITDENIYNMVENGIRGGISMISTRWAKANNPRLHNTFDVSLPRQDLIYLDANNLYGHAMSQYLPTARFRLLPDDEIELLKLEDLDDEADDGYIYEVDLHYPTRLHNQHDDCPLAPESLFTDRSMYLPIQISVFPESAPQRKLTPNLMDKSRYVVHYRNLKLYVQLGLIITKIHRVLAFKQSPWLKSYIDFNSHQRTLSYSGFLKDFFNLMKNSVFGKTQENLRKRVQVDIVTDASILRKRVAKPSFCRGIPITDCITVVQCNVQTLTLNLPIYVGFTVLELSELHMYEFHYQHMKVK